MTSWTSVSTMPMLCKNRFKTCHWIWGLFSPLLVSSAPYREKLRCICHHENETATLQHPRQQSFYNHYTDQPLLVSIPVKNCKILLEQSFTAHMPLLMATSTFGLGTRCYRSPQQNNSNREVWFPTATITLVLDNTVKLEFFIPKLL